MHNLILQKKQKNIENVLKEGRLTFQRKCSHNWVSISCSSCRASTPYVGNRDSITNSQTPYIGSKDFLVPAYMNSLFVKMLLILCTCVHIQMYNRDSITNSQTPYMGSKDLVPADMNSLFLKIFLILCTCIHICTTEKCSRRLTWIDCLFDNYLDTLYLINPITNSQTPYLQATETNKKKETDLLILREETFEQRYHQHWPAKEWLE